MSPRKAPREQNDPNKKRKRDIAESNANSKRQRAQQTNNGAAATTEKKSTNSTTHQNGDVDMDAGAVQKLNTVEAGWRLSTPMGGRMLDIDPILTEDNQYVTSALLFNPII